MTEPGVLTRKTYFWRPGGNAGQRRRSERQKCDEVEAWLKELGFPCVERSGCMIRAEWHGTQVLFSYSESCANVYKTMSVVTPLKRSNITLLRKIGAMSHEEADAYLKRLLDRAEVRRMIHAVQTGTGGGSP